MLQELRIALPGVQVLFAFLLAVPFQQNFTEVTDFQKSVYFVTLLLTALSTASYHCSCCTLCRRQIEPSRRCGVSHGHVRP